MKKFLSLIGTKIASNLKRLIVPIFILVVLKSEY